MSKAKSQSAKPRVYYPYPEAQRGPKLQELKSQLPEILLHLSRLPKATGEVDQAEDLLKEFNEQWNRFRIGAMKCCAKDWLKEHVYSTSAWDNRNALKRSSTGHRLWKKKYMAEYYQRLSEEQRETRRRRDRDRPKSEWFDFERAVGLAKRCLKADHKTESVSYQPVIRLLKKHCQHFGVDRATERVMMVIRCLQWDPQDETTERKLSRALKMGGLKPEAQAQWRQFARERYEASHQKQVNDVLRLVDADLDAALAPAAPAEQRKAG
jgi:transcriptional regulator NrdR family protein